MGHYDRNKLFDNELRGGTKSGKGGVRRALKEAGKQRFSFFPE